MKTLTSLLLTLTLAGFLFSQTDSTITDTTEAIVAEPAIEVADSVQVAETEDVVSDSTELSVVPLDSVDVETLALDSILVDSTAFAEEDSIVVVEPEMAWFPKDPAPTVVTGLMNQGPLYYWSNDGLATLDLESLSYVTIEDPTMIAIKANDCLDVVCHLLATDSTGVNFVIVTPDDSSNYKIYDTETKVVVLEAPADSLVAAFHAYLQEIAGSEYLAVEIPADEFVGPILADDQLTSFGYDARAKALKIKRRQFRDMEALSDNPANLARDFDSFTSWNFILDLELSVHNSILTPGWYKTWLTTGEVLDAEATASFAGTLADKDLAIGSQLDFANLFGFRIGHFGLNLSHMTYLQVSLPGNLPAQIFQPIEFDQAYDFSGLDIEVLPSMAAATVSYAHPLSTPFGEIKLGVALNNYMGTGYSHIKSDDFTVELFNDSLHMAASGEGWYTQAGIEGHLDSLIVDDMDVASTMSDYSMGIDLGIIMDLQPLIDQELEVQVSLKNIGASYKWSGLTHSTWSFEQVIPGLDVDALDTIDLYIEAFQNAETDIIGTDEELTIDIPTVLNISAFYQPISRVLIGAGIEKAFTDENRMGYSSDLALNYQLNLFATPWMDFSYYKRSQYGEPVHTFGSGLHFGFLETGLTLSFYNGLNTDAKGIGFGLSSSLHF